MAGFISKKKFRRGGGAVQPYRVISSESRPANAVRSMGTDTEGLAYVKYWVGSAAINTISLRFNGWYGGANAPINIPNSYTILEASVSKGAAWAQIKRGGSGTFTVNPGENDIAADDILTSALGLSSIAAGDFFWVAIKFSVPTTSNSIPYPIRAIAQNAGQQALYYNPANTFPSTALAAGGFTTTGVAPTSSTGTLMPIALGKFVTGDPITIANFGDSIFESVGDVSSTTPGGIGMAARAMWGDGTAPIASLIMAKSGSLEQYSQHPTVAYWARFARKAICQAGTNNFDTSGTLVTAAAKSALDDVTHAALMAQGCEQILRVEMMPRTTSTDVFVTEANQTYTAGWGPAGNVASYRTLTAAKVGVTIAGVIGLAALHGTDYYKWPAPPASCLDGAHPVTAKHITAATEIRSTALSVFTV